MGSGYIVHDGTEQNLTIRNDLLSGILYCQNCYLAKRPYNRCNYNRNTLYMAVPSHTKQQYQKETKVVLDVNTIPNCKAQQTETLIIRSLTTVVHWEARLTETIMVVDVASISLLKTHFRPFRHDHLSIVNLLTSTTIGTTARPHYHNASDPYTLEIVYRVTGYRVAL